MNVVAPSKLLESSKDKKLDSAGESAKEKQTPPGVRMIHLDDFIPAQDVKGGARVFFGGKNPKSTVNKPRK